MSAAAGADRRKPTPALQALRAFRTESACNGRTQPPAVSGWAGVVKAVSHLPVAAASHLWLRFEHPDASRAKIIDMHPNTVDAWTA
jgi:hypothetical protein